MPDISIDRWERLEPRLGNNLTQPQAKRFYLEVNASLTKAQLVAFQDAQVAAMNASNDAKDFSRSVKPMTDALAPFVRMGAEPLLVDGKPVATLEQYVELCLSMAGLFNLLEMTRTVREYNELGGTFAHFSKWRSGGDFGTRAQSVEQDSAQTDAR